MRDRDVGEKAPQGSIPQWFPSSESVVFQCLFPVHFMCIPSAPLDELSTPPATRVPLFSCPAFPVPRACVRTRLL